MKIGHSNVEMDLVLEDGFDSSSAVTVLDSPSATERKLPEVGLKATGFPPNCDPKECVASATFPYMKSQVEYFNPLQSAFINEVAKDNNVVVCGTTSCGKTLVAEQVISYTLSEVRKTNPTAKAAYISPLKALASEKQADWTSPNHWFSQYKISILTGDFTLTDDRKKELAEADIICMSSEMLGSRVRKYKAEKNSFLDQFCVLIQDESHMLGTDRRGPQSEVALMKFTEMNKNCRIIFLSATMPNYQEMGAWLTLLNGKKSTVVKSDYRPVKLNWNYELFLEGKNYTQTEQNKCEKAVEVVQKYPNDKFIVFVHAKKTGRKILGLLEHFGIPAKFHNADVDSKNRFSIEANFKSKESGSLRVLVATSTLAMGLNLPARRVIITGITRGLNLVDPMEISQEAGRSGRILLDPQGDAHVLIRLGKKDKDIAHCHNVGPILSKISDVNALAFHLVSEIAEGNVKNEGQALKWFERTLAHKQNIIETTEHATAKDIIHKTFDTLLKCGAITQKTDSNYIATTIGKVSSWFYLCPFDVSDWCNNFRRILSSRPTEEHLAWALGNTNTARSEFASNDENWLMSQVAEKLMQHSLPAEGGVTKHCAALYSLLRGEDPESGELGVIVGRYRMDGDRITSAIKMLMSIGKYFDKCPYEHVLYELPYRMRYGMGDHGMELLVIPGIGRVTANSLIKNRHIATCKQLIAAQSTGIKVFKDDRWEKIKDVVQEVATVGHVEYLKQQSRRKKKTAHSDIVDDEFPI
jgi:helicase